MPGPPAQYLIPAEWQSLPLSASFRNNLAADKVELVYTDEYGSGLGKMPKTNFAPRLDGAYQLSEKYVVRGGYGLFYGAFENRGGNPSLGYNYPFQFTLLYQSPNDVAAEPAPGRLARRPRCARPDTARLDQRERQRSHGAWRRVRLSRRRGITTTTCRFRAKCCPIIRLRSATSGRREETWKRSPA